jgi:DNA-binding NtrC family response regulator
MNKGGRAVAVEGFIDERLRAGSTDLHAEATTFMARIMLIKVLKHTAGNQSQAAKILNITRGTLRSRIRELGIRIDQAVHVNAALPEAVPASSAPGSRHGSAAGAR